MINFFQEDISLFNFDEEIVSEWLASVVDDEDFILGDLSVIFCSDSYLLDINKKYLQHDFYTDVVTFDYTVGSVISGDLFISTDRVKENSEQFQVSFDLELRRICVHGLLHLLGYKDKEKDDKIEMTSKEDFYLNKLD